MNALASKRGQPEEGVAATLRAHGTLAPFIGAAWACSVLYEVVLGRHLAPRAYGAFETVVSVLAMSGVVAAVAQLGVARQAAAFGAPDRAWSTWSTLGAAAAGLAAWGGGHVLAQVFRLHLPTHTWLTVGSITALWIALAAIRGLAQGLERYVPLGTSYFVENAGRLLGTWLWVPRFGYWGGLGAIAAGAALAGVSLLLWVPWRTRAAVHAQGRDLLVYLFGNAVGAMLPALPLVLLRARLPSLPLAAYAAMLLLLRAQAQVAGWLSTALYPRLIVRPELAGRSFGVTALLAVGVGLGVAAVAAGGLHLLLAVAFRGRYTAYAEEFRVSLFAGLPLALTGLWLTRALALRDTRRLLLIASSIPLLAGGILLFGARGLDTVVWLGALPALPLAVDTLWPVPSAQAQGEKATAR